jgi:hypothetical protein
MCSFESLSGHIPRSSLRSSDLLPFYHQYPAACCGDFLFVFARYHHFELQGAWLIPQAAPPVRHQQAQDLISLFRQHFDRADNYQFGHVVPYSS